MSCSPARFTVRRQQLHHFGSPSTKWSSCKEQAPLCDATRHGRPNLTAPRMCVKEEVCRGRGEGHFGRAPGESNDQCCDDGHEVLGKQAKLVANSSAHMCGVCSKPACQSSTSIIITVKPGNILCRTHSGCLISTQSQDTSVTLFTPVVILEHVAHRQDTSNPRRTAYLEGLEVG
jgi:hypothetical protein